MSELPRLVFEQVRLEFRTPPPGVMIEPNGATYARSKIPGGWLVQCMGGLAFVPDPEHKWDGNSLP